MSEPDDPPALAHHPVDPAVAAEFPSVRLASVVVAARAGPSHAGVREQLALLSDRLAGAHAIALRQQPVPHAYRVFFRQVGLDPDRRRTPIEQAVLDRLRHGAYR
ncbi:MAG: hypothetical protein M3296_06780 [Actinomycetota bacterium]|nr:hypothetical protein [Actinomycetota bacterium]